MTITQRELAQSVFRPFVVGGEEGGCVACNKVLSAHFDKRGNWLGCARADEHTTFILVPVKTVRSTMPVVTTPRRRSTDTQDTPVQAAQVPVKTIRSAEPVIRPRYVYAVKDRRVRPELSPIRARVYDALRAAPSGLVSAELKFRTKLVHGSIQQTLNWLRAKKLVVANAIEE